MVAGVLEPVEGEEGLGLETSPVLVAHEGPTNGPDACRWVVIGKMNLTPSRGG
jgi:hypothetical protein